MSAVRKPEIIPIRVVEPAPDEPRFTPVEEMFAPPIWGKYEHSEADLRVFWSRIWRAFKSRRLCEGFLQHNRLHSLDVWAASFEWVRQKKDQGFEHIGYVDATAYGFEKDGTPDENARRKAEKIEQAKRTMKPQIADPDDPDVKAFARRNNVRPLDDMADHPLTLKFKNRNRGEK